MKIVGGGSELTQDPSRAIRFVLENSAVHAMVLGMMNEQEILENIGLTDEFVTA